MPGRFSSTKFKTDLRLGSLKIWTTAASWLYPIIFNFKKRPRNSKTRYFMKAIVYSTPMGALTLRGSFAAWIDLQKTNPFLRATSWVVFWLVRFSFWTTLTYIIIMQVFLWASSLIQHTKIVNIHIYIINLPGCDFFLSI